jgi:hypothetical protein
LRQLHVQKDEIESLVARPLDGVATIAGHLNLMARDGQPEAEHLRNVRVVLDQ